MIKTLRKYIFKLRQSIFRFVFLFLPVNYFKIHFSKENKQETLIESRDLESILFIGNDAYRAGAQILLLNLIRWLINNTQINFRIILLKGGSLLQQYQQLAPTIVWEEFYTLNPDYPKRQNALTQFTGKVDLIYGNTVLSAAIYNELKFLRAPIISHIHELEKSIQAYTIKKTRKQLKSNTAGYIACSSPVNQNLQSNHNIKAKKIITIFEYIENIEIDLIKPKKDYRQALGLAEDGLLIVGCGTIYWRKGPDIFIDTALNLRKKGLENFHFYWMGDNLWDADPISSGLCSWNDLEKKIKDNGLSDFITFLGEKETVTDYFLACDLFYLPSREDPFPLVCLEAAQVSLPVICFDGVGGMPDFVENNAGFVVPFGDIDTVVEKLLYLNENRQKLTEMGLLARKKVLERHLVDIAGPQILDYCRSIYMNQIY